MKAQKIIDFSHYRTKSDNFPKRKRSKLRKKGSVYARNGKLWVDFRYLKERVREPSGLKDTKANRIKVRKQLDLILAEIENGLFEFAKRFSHSKRKDYFTELEGKTVTRRPEEVVYGEYVEKWWPDMEPGMSFTQIQDYKSILKTHLLPYFGKMPLSEFWSPFQMKKFIAQLKAKKTRYKTPLSGKRIQNIMIPLRVTVKDAADEYGWHDLHDPFAKLKLPKARKIRIYPFSFDEWVTLKKFFSDWYKPFFEFAVQTGLRPSEQVALKWSAIDAEFIHIELSRVKNREKTDLKTEESRRMIAIRPTMRKVLEDQWELTKEFDSPYVFLNINAKPVLQDKAREVWARAMKKSGLRYRRMYETRHTFASWALGAGESPEWVARTLGHVNTSMVYKTYGRYIPNLTRQDGSALEKLYLESTKNKRDTDFMVTIGHNFGHNRENPHPQSELTP